MAGTGFFALWLAAWLATRKRKDVDQTQIPHIALAAMAGLFIGAHLLYGAVNFRIFIRAARDHFSLIHSVTDFMYLLAAIFGGMFSTEGFSALLSERRGI